MNSFKPRRNGYIVLSFVIILFITGLAKVLTSFSSQRIFTLDDPVFGIEFRYLLPLVGVLEWGVAYCCIVMEQYKAYLIVAAISTMFLIYRIGEWLTGWRQPCHCLGSLTGMLDIPPHISDLLTKGILAYLLLFSYGYLCWRLLGQHKMKWSKAIEN